MLSCSPLKLLIVVISFVSHLHCFQWEIHFHLELFSRTTVMKLSIPRNRIMGAFQVLTRMMVVDSRIAECCFYLRHSCENLKCPHNPVPQCFLSPKNSIWKAFCAPTKIGELLLDPETSVFTQTDFV